MSSIFDKDKIGRNIWCLLEKDGVEKKGLVNWLHCYLGEIVKLTEMVDGTHMVTTGGWKVKTIDVLSPFFEYEYSIGKIKLGEGQVA